MDENTKRNQKNTMELKQFHSTEQKPKWIHKNCFISYIIASKIMEDFFFKCMFSKTKMNPKRRNRKYEVKQWETSLDMAKMTDVRKRCPSHKQQNWSIKFVFFFFCYSILWIFMVDKAHFQNDLKKHVA